MNVITVFLDLLALRKPKNLDDDTLLINCCKDCALIIVRIQLCDQLVSLHHSSESKKPGCMRFMHGQPSFERNLWTLGIH